MRKNLQHTFTHKKNKKNITTLMDQKGNVLQKNTEILNKCKNFYQKLLNNQRTCVVT